MLILSVIKPRFSGFIPARLRDALAPQPVQRQTGEHDIQGNSDREKGSHGPWFGND
jgi:hypothetical protein